MVQSAPPRQPVRKLRIAETIGEAYSSVLNNFAACLRIMLAPALLAVPIAAIGFALVQTRVADIIGSDSEGSESMLVVMQSAWLEIALGELIGFIPGVFFAVAWHRFVLLGERPRFALNVIRPRALHFKFYLYFIMFLLVIAFVTGLLTGIGALIATLLPGSSATGVYLVIGPLLPLNLVLSLYLTARLEFVFPAVAVGEHYSFFNSWRNTRGQGWRLLLVIVCCFLPPLFLTEMLSAFFIKPASLSVLFFISSFVSVVLGFLATAVVVSAVSIAFRTCTGWIPPPANQPPANS